MNKLTLDDVAPAGKRVLMRVDFNVPMRDGEIADDSRIRASLATIRRLTDAGAKVVLMSHLGRPKGEPDPELSLAPVAQRLAKLLEHEVHFVDDCVGQGPFTASENLETGQVLLLENLRFHPEEEGNDPGFSKQLAHLGDIYVNNAFGTAHRAHASTVGVAEYFDQAAAGLLMERELRYLTGALQDPASPFVAVMGGAKISGKLNVLRNLLGVVDCILVGGGMIYTLFKVQGIAVGDSMVDSGREDKATEILSAAESADAELVLPVDSIVSTAADGSEGSRATSGPEIPDGFMGVDIGPETAKLFRNRLADARTIVWNGPLGIFEVPEFANGTTEVAREIAAATTRGAITIVGGGDSVAAIHKCGLSESDFSHVSTGGGAFLEFLEGKDLPGVAALTEKS